MRPVMQARRWLSPIAVSFAGGSFSKQVFAQDLPVGTIVNFGPNLQPAAGGVCRQPEGIAIDPDGNFYLSSNSDSATTVGHVCVLNSKGQLTDIINVPANPNATTIGLIGELWEGDYLYVLDQADNIVGNGRILKINPASHQVTSLTSTSDGLAFPNDIKEDRHGNLYITDSLLGAIFKLSAEDSKLSLWFADPALVSTNPIQNVAPINLSFAVDQNNLYY